MTSSGPEPGRTRDRRVLWRAGIAGTGSGLLLALVLGGSLAPGGGRAVLAGISWALAGGLLVTAGWASLALLLDLLRDRPVGRPRAVWTVGLVLVALVMPLFAAAASSLG